MILDKIVKSMTFLDMIIQLGFPKYCGNPQFSKIFDFQSWNFDWIWIMFDTWTHITAYSAQQRILCFAT